MKKSVLVFAFAVMFFGCKSDEITNTYTPPPPSTTGSHTITAGGVAFVPPALNVKVGDTINFVWSSGTHTTTSISVPAGAATWDAPLVSSASTFRYIVTKAGIYNYKCTFHESMGMTASFTAN